MLDERKRETIIALAECNMNASQAAAKTNYHRNTFLYQIEQIKKKTGLDPTNFYDLIKLLEIATAKEEHRED